MKQVEWKDILISKFNKNCERALHYLGLEGLAKERHIMEEQIQKELLGVLYAPFPDYHDWQIAGLSDEQVQLLLNQQAAAAETHNGGPNDVGTEPFLIQAAKGDDQWVDESGGEALMHTLAALEACP